jgi:hypothetical protein
VLFRFLEIEMFAMFANGGKSSPSESGERAEEREPRRESRGEKAEERKPRRGAGRRNRNVRRRNDWRIGDVRMWNRLEKR